MLVIGENAPSFELPIEGGETKSLGAYAGQYLVLFFYPKDDTSGCTKEAIGFSARQADFAALNCAILGASKDSVAKHDKFVEKHTLTVSLLSDADSDLCERYGVWKEKSMYGKTYMGIERTTFLIAPDGKIAHIWPKVRVPGHVDAVYDHLKELGA